MTSDSTPAFEIEKEALKTEIETGIQAGVDHLEAKTAKRKDADKYHNTRHLLKQYRKVAYAIQISEADMNVRMEMEHGTRLSTLEVNAELAGVDLSGSKLEGYARTVIRSKNMLQIIDNALNTVRMDPDHGELMYQVLYLTYFSKKKPANREVILAELDRQGFPMSMVTYHSYLNMAIRAIDRILADYDNSQPVSDLRLCCIRHRQRHHDHKGSSLLVYPLIGKRHAVQLSSTDGGGTAALLPRQRPRLPQRHAVIL